MNRIWSVLGLFFLASVVAVAAPSVPQNSQPFPSVLLNARYVYVTSYDGDALNPRILPEDRQAIANVQDALKSWGHYIVVYRPQEADMILAVQSRGSEDVLAVYDPHYGTGSTFLWREMARGGLDKNELPIFSSFRSAVESAEQSARR